MCSLATHRFIHSANTFGLHLLLPGTVIVDGNKLKNEIIMNLQKANGPKFLDPPMEKKMHLLNANYMLLCAISFV